MTLLHGLAHLTWPCAALIAGLRVLQLEAAQKRADAAAATLREERSAHRRVLRHKNRELAEAQVRQSTEADLKLGRARQGAHVCSMHLKTAGRCIMRCRSSSWLPAYAVGSTWNFKYRQGEVARH